MTTSTESQMAPTRRIVNFMAYDPVPAGTAGSTEGLREFYRDSTRKLLLPAAHEPLELEVHRLDRGQIFLGLRQAILGLLELRFQPPGVGAGRVELSLQPVRALPRSIEVSRRASRGHAPPQEPHDDADEDANNRANHGESVHRRVLPLPGSDLHVLVRRGVRVAGDQAEPRLLDPWADAVQERELPDRDEDLLLVHELLDLHEDRLALLPVELRGLLAEEPVDVRVAAVDVRAAGHHEGFEPRGRVAERSAGPVREVLVLLLRPLLEEGRALYRAQLRANPDVPEVVENRLLHVGVR